ncbi:hypothetical protein [Streptomyces sp. NBC_01497]|uniref:hypothetical protein n=1 Tax=Streptomyces sp. NBC_01497 TaxID=2903885 RepID=UPI002E32DB2F|nr:hypothetical protein [Streptomyces sp. NBC_01497]
MLSQLPAVLAGYRREQTAHVVAHTAAEFHAVETMTDGCEEVVQFKVSLRGGMLGNHLGRLPRHCHYAGRCRTIEGRSP